jgi:hypothetical protein
MSGLTRQFLGFISFGAGGLGFITGLLPDLLFGPPGYLFMGITVLAVIVTATMMRRDGAAPAAAIAIPIGCGLLFFGLIYGITAYFINSDAGIFQ